MAASEKIANGTETTRRRVFINKGDNRYQIYQFIQGDDGTIYCWSPDFADAKWLSYELTQNGPLFKGTAAVGDGKLSLHGSGMTTVRPHDDPRGHRLIIKGNHLLDKEKHVLGTRHLFTTFPKEPNFQPQNSPAFKRKSDYAMQANEELKPFVLIFFAVPRGLNINFQFNLHEEQMHQIPNDFLGWHSFPLRYHEIFWFAYRTKHLDKWPKYSHFSYQDGYDVPVFIGNGNQELHLEFRKPAYSLVDNTLTIQCLSDYADN